MAKKHELEQLAYNLSEAAKIIGISKPTMSRMLKDGEIQHRRYGRRLLISRSALERWLEEAE